MRSRNITRKTGAVLLIFSMALSFCGCSMFSKKDVLAAAKEVADNIENFDADRLLELSTLNKNGEKAENLRKGLNGEFLDEKTKKFCDAVRKTIRYEIVEDSFSVKGKEATIDIEFRLADYKSLLREKYGSIDELVKAVDNCDDTIKVTYGARFVKEDGQWLLDNLMGSSFLGIFDFMDADIGALAVDLKNIVKSSTWSGASDDTYKNTRRLSLVVEFDSDISKLSGKGVTMIYTVSKDGEDVWTSKPAELGNSTRLTLNYSTSQNPDAALRSNYLAAGEYKFKLQDSDGNEFYSASVNVTVAVTETNSGTSTSSKGYVFNNREFAAKVLKAGWANLDNTRVSTASYGSDVTSVSFQIQVDPAMNENLYFAYFYAATVSEAMKIKPMTDTPAITGTSKPIINSNGTFYAMGLKAKTGKNFNPGIYIVAIFSEDKETFYGLAECQVLSKPASSYKN
ncbi:MAG: hypothetical protein IKT20_01560 [Clostridiales bacterium]|nr:hypothetical protein [Clostridiales bacterium]